MKAHTYTKFYVQWLFTIDKEISNLNSNLKQRLMGRYGILKNAIGCPYGVGVRKTDVLLINCLVIIIFARHNYITCNCGERERESG